MIVEWVEWIGYAASCAVAVSLLMTNIIRLRIINTVGCILFVIYGLLVGAYPVVISNIAIMLINAYQLIKLKRERR